MPWHDVHMTLTGEVVLDIVQHFVERWNEIKKRKVSPVERRLFTLLTALLIYSTATTSTYMLLSMHGNSDPTRAGGTTGSRYRTTSKSRPRKPSRALRSASTGTRWGAASSSGSTGGTTTGSLRKRKTRQRTCVHRTEHVACRLCAAYRTGAMAC